MVDICGGAPFTKVQRVAIILVNACIIASERNGVLVRMRVILRAVGNSLTCTYELRRTLRYGDIQTKNRPVQTTRSTRSLAIIHAGGCKTLS